MKKSFLSLSVALLLSFNSANAGGVPVIDVSAIQQAILHYLETIESNAQLLKQYEQMIKDSTNQLAQMKEQGIGMDIEEILGNVRKIVDKSLTLIDYEISQDIFQESADIINVCSFLEQESTYFADKIKEASDSGGLKDKINACVTTANTEEISKTIKELTDIVVEATDQRVINNTKHKIRMIEKALAFLQQRTNAQRSSKIINLYDNYVNGDTNNPYSKEKFNEDLKMITTQLKTANNQKQAAALTNTLLLKLLELSNKNYELSLNYYSMVANEQKSKENNDEQDYQEEAKETIDYTQTQSYKDFQSNSYKVIYNQAGLPDIAEMTKVK